MDFRFPLDAKIKLENNFSFICTFLNTFEKELLLLKLKPHNIINDLPHCVQKKKVKTNSSRN